MNCDGHKDHINHRNRVNVMNKAKRSYHVECMNHRSLIHLQDHRTYNHDYRHLVFIKVADPFEARVCETSGEANKSHESYTCYDCKHSSDDQVGDDDDETPG